MQIVEATQLQMRLLDLKLKHSGYFVLNFFSVLCKVVAYVFLLLWIDQYFGKNARNVLQIVGYLLLFQCAGDSLQYVSL